MGFRPVPAARRGAKIGSPKTARIRLARNSNPNGNPWTELRLNPAACHAIGLVPGEVNPLILLWDSERFRLGFLRSDDPSWGDSIRRIRCGRQRSLVTSIERILFDESIPREKTFGEYPVVFDPAENIHYIDLSHVQASQKYRDRLKLVRSNGAA